jgi:tRNA(Ile)-lysidine synthase
MREEVLRLILLHRLIEPQQRLLVACSGGGDSVALLHLLRALSERLEVVIHVAHLDHGIRPEGRRDAEFVARLCSEWGVPLASARLDIPALAKKRGLGLEETARLYRRTFLQETATRLGCAAIALGHHRADQAETVVHRLLRGTGSTGLAAMRLKQGPFIRPFLHFSQQVILAYLTEHGINYVEDASNSDLCYTRNRIRHQLLPHLEEFNPRIEEHLAHISNRLALEEDYWSQQEAQALDNCGEKQNGDLRLSVAALLALHPALRLRVLRRALGVVRGDVAGLSARHLAGVEKLLLSNHAPQGECHLPQAWVGRRYQWLWLRRTAPSTVAPAVVVIDGAGSYPLPGGVLQVQLRPQAVGEEGNCIELAAAEIRFPLQVRFFSPGDRFRPAGMVGRRKLKDYFGDMKMERQERLRQPLLVMGEEILWVVGLRRAEGRRAAPGEAVLRLLWQQEGRA